MKHKVLVVEDEQDTADLLTRILEREGFSVLQVQNGRQASTLIGTVRPPSLILLDLVIPYVSGPELLRMIRENTEWKQVPIIVVSADSYEPDIQRALRDGATAYVTKQKGSMSLLQTIKRTLSTGSVQDPTSGRVASGPPRKRPALSQRRSSSQRKKRTV